MNPFEKPNEEMEWYRISYEELPLIINFLEMVFKPFY